MAKITDTTPARTFTIEISEDEAHALWGICNRIGGRFEGPRAIFSSGNSESIIRQLESFGIEDDGRFFIDGNIDIDTRLGY